MIGSLEGRIEHLGPGLILVETGGIGFMVKVDVDTQNKLKKGEKHKLKISTIMSDKNIELYGFIDESKQRTFETLVKIPKIGPGLALNIISHLSPGELMEVVASEDVETMRRIPGIGLKTAERIIFELKRRWKDLEDLKTLAPIQKEAVDALVALGYTKQDAMRAVRKALQSSEVSKGDVQQLVKIALRVIFDGGDGPDD